MSPSAPSVSERWIEVRGLGLCVEDRGSGPAVLLAHGMWCDAGMFAGVAAALARDARVIVPDLRAHGRSDVPDGAWSIRDLAEDLGALLDALKLDRVVLCGFSMGGMAAVDFALRYQARLDGLVLIGTSAAAEDLVRILQIRALARMIQLGGAPKFLPHEAARPTFSPAFRRSHPREVERWQSAVGAMPRKALVQALRAVGGRPSLLDEMEKLKVPTVIAAGGADRVLRPHWSREMQRRVGGSRLVVFPKVGHIVPVERPAETADLIRGLLPLR